MSVFIKFIDGEELIIDNVSGYSIDNSSNIWKLQGRHNMIYINKSQVKYIGNAKDFGKAGEAVG